MRHFLIIAISILSSLPLVANSLGEINGTCWHDGCAFYYASQQNGEITFQGGTLHEGGYGFKVVKGSDDVMVLASIYEDIDVTTLAGNSVCGSSIERRTIEGKDVLVVTSPKGGVTDVLLKMEPNDSFEDILKQQYNQQLDGVYQKNGAMISFNGEGRMSIGTALDHWEYYSFVKIFDTPFNILSIHLDRDYFSFDFDSQYLKLDFLKPEPGVDWDDFPKIDTLSTVRYEKVRGYRYKGDGIWPITSVEILTSGYLSHYNLETLMAMHNDIFARHGYKFNTKKWLDFFNAQWWYHPISDNISAINLSEIEQINVQLIKNMERVKALEE